jgi:hypothetical protein
MSTLYQKVRENQRKQRQLAKRAKHRKGKAAARIRCLSAGLSTHQVVTVRLSTDRLIDGVPLTSARERVLVAT